MSQFSGQMKLPSNSYKQRLGVYGIYSFGVPALMTLTVVILNQNDISNSNLFDPEVDNSGSIVNENWRPGIGEESCWLSSCSYGQLIYFYLPIGITLVSNLVMFIYASRIMQRLQKNKKYLRQSTTESSVSHRPTNY